MKLNTKVCLNPEGATYKLCEHEQITYPLRTRISSSVNIGVITEPNLEGES